MDTIYMNYISIDKTIKLCLWVIVECIDGIYDFLNSICQCNLSYFDIQYTRCEKYSILHKDESIFNVE